MQQKYNDPTPQRPEGKRAIDAPIVKFDLKAHLAQIRQEPTYEERDRNAITLFKSDHLRLVLISLHAGAEMKTHAPDGISSLQVLDGEISFAMGEYHVDLQAGEVIAVHENIPHAIIARTEAALLLTMTGNDAGQI